VTLALSDIAVAAGATAQLYSDDAFSTEITGDNTLSLTAGSTTTAYIKVTAEDGTVKYYAVAISLVASSDASLSSVARRRMQRPARRPARTPITPSGGK
jgi:VCBS repeat-containing protein